MSLVPIMLYEILNSFNFSIYRNSTVTHVYLTICNLPQKKKKIYPLCVTDCLFLGLRTSTTNYPYFTACNPQALLHHPRDHMSTLHAKPCELCTSHSHVNLTTLLGIFSRSFVWVVWACQVQCSFVWALSTCTCPYFKCENDLYNPPSCCI